MVRLEGRTAATMAAAPAGHTKECQKKAPREAGLQINFREGL
jgi:hypothetical protein